MRHGPVSVRRLLVTAAAPLASRVGFTARMEDALRTSSLPAGWNRRLVLIQRLRLRAGEQWPAHLLARRVESIWRAEATQAIPALQAGADAPAVWFADEPSARLALIRRLARGDDVSAWFWRRWLPAGTDVARRIAQVLAATDAAKFPAAERVRFFEDACRAIAEPALIDRVIACCDAAQLRGLLPESALTVALSAGERSAERRADERRRAEATSGECRGSAEIKAIAAHVARAALKQGAAAAALRGSGEQREPVSALAGEGADTEWAGLFFALNLFRHVDRPASAVRWLRDVATFARVAADDPVLAVLDRLDACVADSTPNEGTPAPLRELRVACLRATRRSLRRVLHRAGNVHLNRTHLTISLRLAEVSLPVRVGGLDIDPGWVASLERVVRFEYE